jgi:hypothetical protein
MRVGQWGMTPHSTTHKQLDPTGNHYPWVKASIPPQNSGMYRRQTVACTDGKQWHVPTAQTSKYLLNRFIVIRF